MALTLPTDVDRSLVAFYRAWDHLERDQFQNTIIDFDLAPHGDVSVLGNRQAVADELVRLRATVGQLRGSAADHVVSRLRASAAYLDALRGFSAVPLRQYVLQTMGIEPALVPDDRLRGAEARLRVSLKNDTKVRGGIPFSRKGWELFRSELQTNAGDNLRRQFEFFCDKWLPRLCRAIATRIEPSVIAVEFAQEDAYWKNWISGDVANGQPITLRINIHERHAWYQGVVENLVLHEYCGHAVQMALWREAVMNREIADFFGVVTVHFPDQFLLEGLAESMVYILPTERFDLESRSKVMRELQSYNLMVLNNVHIIANDSGLEAGRRYARQRLPFTSEDTIERELRDRTTHPLFRAYQYVYGPAKETFVRGLESCGIDRRWSLLQRLYRVPLMADQIRALFNGNE